MAPWWMPRTAWRKVARGAAVCDHHAFHQHALLNTAHRSLVITSSRHHK